MSPVCSTDERIENLRHFVQHIDLTDKIKQRQSDIGMNI